MTLNDLEKAVWNEIKTVTGRKKLRLKDIMMWSTYKEVVEKDCEPGEVVVHCPELNVWAIIPEK